MNPKQHGFSLIEVLVALMILAIVMLSVAALCEHSIRFTSHMRDHLNARWIAQNALAELQLGLKPLPNNAGEQTNDETMNNATWSWKAKVADTNFAHILKANITVKKANSNDITYHFQGYVKGSLK